MTHLDCLQFIKQTTLKSLEFSHSSGGFLLYYEFFLVSCRFSFALIPVLITFVLVSHQSIKRKIKWEGFNCTLKPREGLVHIPFIRSSYLLFCFCLKEAMKSMNAAGRVVKPQENLKG